MSLNLSVPSTKELKPRIVVFGVGGAGGNAVNNMIDADLQGVEFVVANTDAQQLTHSRTDRRIQLGVEITQGLGAGAHPEVGMSAAQESESEIAEQLEGAHMVFITAGMGGGTGTGAAPIIAKLARERGILTVGVVTKPFTFEGRHRMRLADQGITELQRYVDTLIVIPNQNLFRVANERTTFAEAFGMADQVLHSGVRSITDLMVLPGLINLDFADVRTVMADMGKAMMGTGEASGEDRAMMAAQNAIQNPLLDETSLKGAKAVLVNVTGGLDMTLLEVDEAANAISAEVDPEANIIFGAAFDPSLDGKLRVSVVATGMDSSAMTKAEPVGRAQTASAVSRPTTSAPSVAARAPEPAPILRTETPIAPPAARTPEPMKAEPAAPLSREVREPMIEQPRTEGRVVGRIVDPMVADEEDVQTDLYGDPIPAPRNAARQPETRAASRPAPEPVIEEETYEPEYEDRRSKGGWRSLFGGRPRYEAPAPATRPAASPQMRSTQSAQPRTEEQTSEAEDDLEIPSFLRRLAN